VDTMTVEVIFVKRFWWYIYSIQFFGVYFISPSRYRWHDFDYWIYGIFTPLWYCL